MEVFFGTFCLGPFNRDHIHGPRVRASVPGKERIELYTICLEKVKTSPTTWQIVGQPMYDSLVCGPYLWYHWVPQQGPNCDLLYTLSLPQGVKCGPYDNRPQWDCVFRCYAFTSATPAVLWQCVPRLRLPRALPHAAARRIPVPYLTAPFRAAGAAPDAWSYITAISVGPGAAGTVLCQQHLPDTGATTQLDLSLVACGTCVRVDVLVPLAHTLPPATRAFFGAVHGLLLVYVPGHCLHFVDCQHPRQPVHVAGWTGPEYVPAPRSQSSRPGSVCGAHIRSDDCLYRTGPCPRPPPPPPCTSYRFGDGGARTITSLRSLGSAGFVGGALRGCTVLSYVRVLWPRPVSTIGGVAQPLFCLHYDKGRGATSGPWFVSRTSCPKF